MLQRFGICSNLWSMMKRSKPEIDHHERDSRQLIPAKFIDSICHTEPAEMPHQYTP